LHLSQLITLAANLESQLVKEFFTFDLGGGQIALFVTSLLLELAGLLLFIFQLLLGIFYRCDYRGELTDLITTGTIEVVVIGKNASERGGVFLIEEYLQILLSAGGIGGAYLTCEKLPLLR